MLKIFMIRCIAILSPAAIVKSPLMIAVDCKLLLVLAVKARISLACSNKYYPADVKVKGRGRRLNNLTPSSSSRSAICLDKAGCETNNFCAARVIFNSCAVATK